MPTEVERLVAAGRVEVVTLGEDELRHWWCRLSTEEGVFCEPASAAGVAALAKLGARERPHGGRDHHRSRSEGHGARRPVVVGDGRTDARGDPRGARMTIHALAPASTANLGPGFDAAAAALDLWNEAIVEESSTGLAVEIEGEGADELPRDASHLSLRGVRAVRAGRAPLLSLHQPHPTRARARLERRGDRDRPRCRRRGLRPRPLAGRAARGRRGARGTRRQSGGGAARRRLRDVAGGRRAPRRADRDRSAVDPGDRRARASGRTRRTRATGCRRR